MKERKKERGEKRNDYVEHLFEVDQLVAPPAQTSKQVGCNGL